MLNNKVSGMLVDPMQDQQLLKDGFIVLPFLNQEEVKHFQDLYKKWHPEDPTTFFKSYFDSRMEYKEEIEEEVKRLFENKMEGFFKNYNAFGGMFVVKPSTKEGHIPPHQDWTFVDEKKSWSINMWCALEDVNCEKGSIKVLKGSHQFYETIRGVDTPDVYREHWELIEQHMESIPMKAGEAIFFFHGIVHGSDPNLKDKPRISLGLTLTPKNEDLYLHILEKEHRIKRYRTYPDFYIDYAAKRGATPELPNETINFEFAPILKSDLIEKIRIANNKLDSSTKFKTNESKSWLEVVKKWFR